MKACLIAAYAVILGLWLVYMVATAAGVMSETVAQVVAAIVGPLVIFAGLLGSAVVTWPEDDNN